VTQLPALRSARACDEERAAPCVWPVRGGGGVAVSKLALRDVAQLTARYVVGEGDRTGGYVGGVMEGLNDRGAGGGGR